MRLRPLIVSIVSLAAVASAQTIDRRPLSPLPGKGGDARGAHSPQPAAPKPTPAPAATPSPHSILGTFQRLSAIAPDKRTREEAALNTACDLVLALSQADGDRAAALIDTVGYQPLPPDGDLALEPARPISVAHFREYAKRRATFDAGRDPVGAIRVREPKDVRAQFPGVAAWALPTDRVVILRTPETGSDWGSGIGCIVVRTRADRTSILGGTLFTAAANVTVPPAAQNPTQSPLPQRNQ